MYGQSDTGDITGPHRARKSSCQRLEMGGISYVLLIVVLPPHDLDRMPEKAQLRKPKIDRKEQSIVILQNERQ